MEENIYIRIGEIPKDEISHAYRGDVIIKEELGVSVYNCTIINDKYHIVMPMPFKEGQGQTYEILIHNVTECRYKVYLVSGIQVGIGSDNEPIIKNVKIIKDITNDFKS